MPNMHECDRGQTYHINATVVRARKMLCWMKRIRTFEIPEIGTVIKVDVDNGVYTMVRWVFFDETGPVSAGDRFREACKTGSSVQRWRIRTHSD